MSTKSLSSAPVSVRVRLAALWTTLMFFYVYADFFDKMTPASVESFGSMETPVGPLTPGLLLIFSVILIVPSAMVCLSVLLPAAVCKWANVVVAVLWSVMSILLLVGTLGSEWYQFYALYQAVEVIVLGVIVWQAWKWPTAPAA